MKHITDQTTPAWTVDWGYKPDFPMAEERSWYMGFRSEEDAAEFIATYFTNVTLSQNEAPRMYRGPVKRIRFET